MTAMHVAVFTNGIYKMYTLWEHVTTLSQHRFDFCRVARLGIGPQLLVDLGSAKIHRTIAPSLLICLALSLLLLARCTLRSPEGKRFLLLLEGSILTLA
eukprot:m.40738 g.40738  ORF g.40738 m.40738 type:complete len:99 (-) comp6017_c0_seq2:2632-2928(-)